MYIYIYIWVIHCNSMGFPHGMMETFSALRIFGIQVQRSPDEWGYYYYFQPFSDRKMYTHISYIILYYIILYYIILYYITYYIILYYIILYYIIYDIYENIHVKIIQYIWFVYMIYTHYILNIESPDPFLSPSMSFFENFPRTWFNRQGEPPKASATFTAASSSTGFQRCSVLPWQKFLDLKSLTHRIRCVVYFYLHENHKKQPNVGKYTTHRILWVMDWWPNQIHVTSMNTMSSEFMLFSSCFYYTVDGNKKPLPSWLVKSFRGHDKSRLGGGSNMFSPLFGEDSHFD